MKFNFKKKVNTDYLLDLIVNNEQRFNVNIIEKQARYRDQKWVDELEDFNGGCCYE